MFCAPELVFDNNQGRRVSFLRFGLPDSFSAVPEGRVPFYIFARSDSFSAVSRALDLVFLFYAPRLIFDGTKGDGSRFHVLRARTHFRRYRGCRIPISCFALPNSFLAVPRASGPFSMFFAPGHIFGGTEVVGSSFHILRSGLVFGGTVGVWSRFNVLRARIRFRRYRGRRVSFSYFACSY
jgi:hypothetical protein